MHIVVMRLFIQMTAVSRITSHSSPIQCILNTLTYQSKVSTFIIKMDHHN